MTGLNPWRAALAALFLLAAAAAGAGAAGPVETSIFAVQGVDVDVTGKDATQAKNQALMDVQVKAFFILVERLGSAGIAESLSSLKPEQIAPYLKSLSIEEESSAPGRYIGKFTVRFLPAKIKTLLANYGVEVPENQAPAIVILPVWKAPEGPQLWEDNLWRAAWTGLRAEQSLVPLVVPLGDFDDIETISAGEAVAGDPLKVEAIRRRYDAKNLLVAVAEPAENGGVHAMMYGDSPLGRIVFDKIYTAEDGTLESAAILAAARFHTAMVEKYKQNAGKLVSHSSESSGGGPSQSMPVAVPFASPSEWNGIRSRILQTPNVIGVDVSTLSGDGAVIRLMYVKDLDTLQLNMESAGLRLSQIGGTWVIQPL